MRRTWCSKACIAGIEADQQPFDPNGTEDRLLLRPYNTVDSVLFLGAGRGVAGLPSQLPKERFTWRFPHGLCDQVRVTALVADRFIQSRQRRRARRVAHRLRDSAMTPAKMFRGVVETVRAAWQDAVDRWGAMPRTPRVTSALLALMIVGGVILRIQGVGFPPRDTFDEQFYGPTAHHILLGVPDHPISHPRWASSLELSGSSCSATTRWDGGSCIWCFGLQTIIIGFWLARQIFASRRAGLVGGRLHCGRRFLHCPFAYGIHRHNARLLHLVERFGGGHCAHLARDGSRGEF